MTTRTKTVDGPPLADDSARTNARAQVMRSALLMLRNHSSVTAHQIAIIDDALAGTVPAPVHDIPLLLEALEVIEELPDLQATVVSGRIRSALEARAAGRHQVDAPAPNEHYDEIRTTLKGAHQLMENISGMERRVGTLGSQARGYTQQITKALRHLDALRAMLVHPNGMAHPVDEGAERDAFVAEGFATHLRKDGKWDAGTWNCWRGWLARAALPSRAVVAPARELSEQEIERALARTMDEVAAKRNMHALDLNTDITVHKTLRNAFARTCAALAAQPTSKAVDAA